MNFLDSLLRTLYDVRSMDANTVIKCLSTLFALVGFPKFLHSDNGTSFMSTAVKDYLFSCNIATSHSTIYHPTGNSQCERFVGTIWKSVLLQLHEQKLPDSSWNLVLDSALGNIRALLKVSTNMTHHERFFQHTRSLGFSKLKAKDYSDQKDAYVRKFVRNKTDPLVEPVQILNKNPFYSEICYKNGRTERVSNNDITHRPDNRAPISRPHLDIPSELPFSDD